ncbi:hypothetical protein [Chitinolyticbacter meiyuanensis]|uniref:hypothetical protein n=1 Tax=Chitinolyticbacter meiyuanensis TaxID=682798 RepID=UPI0011E5A5CD|nr:hypothetical protein [Chitinolyticbacter meiyuanensis]
MLNYLGNDRLGQVLAICSVLVVVVLLTIVSPNLAVVGSVGLFGLVLFYYSRLALGRGLIYWWIAGFVVLGCISLIRTATGAELPPVLLLSFFAFALLGAWNGQWRATPTFLAVALFALYVCLLMMSSWFGRSQPTAAFYQVMYDLRPLLLLLVAGAFARQYRFLMRSLDVLAVVVLVVSIPFVLVQSLVPDLYAGIFVFARDGAGVANPLIPILPGRALGFFVHSSVLAQYCVFFVFWTAIRLWFGQVRERRYKLVLAGYVVMLAMSGQRQETLATCGVLALLWVFMPGGRTLLRLVVAALLFSCGLAAALSIAGEDAIYQIARDWGLVANAWVWEPRAVMYQFGIKLAHEYWPLGTGAGTFGGVGAARNDQTLYFELGFMRFFWFVESKWLMDTYWPHIFAEGGWLAFGLLLAFYLFLTAQAGLALRSTQDTALRQLFALAFAGLAFNLLNSPTSASISDINYMWPYLPFIGLPFCRWPRDPAEVKP